MASRQKSPVLGGKPNSIEGAHKRTPKACNRCRTKKAKCDGIVPCGKCQANNTICNFSERKRPRDKVYPKGYTNFLEEQQGWLIYGIQGLYRRIHAREGWPGEPLNCEANGQPLTHDILARLGALEQGKRKYFQEDKEAMQQKFHEHSDGNTQRPESSNGSSHGLTPVHILQATPKYITSSPTRIEAQADSDSASFPLPTQDVVEPMSPITLQYPFQLVLSGNGIFDQMDLTDLASHVSLFNNDIPMSSPMLGHLPAIDCVASGSLTGTWHDTEELGQCLNPATTDLLAMWSELW